MSYSKSFRTSSFRLSKEDDASPYVSNLSNRSGSHRESLTSNSLTTSRSILSDLDSSSSYSSGRKKFRSDFDNAGSNLDYNQTMQASSKYSSSRRFDSSGLTSSYARELNAGRRSYLDDDDDDPDKYSPRRLGMLTNRQISSTSTSTFKTISKQDDLDDLDDYSISSTYKKTRYNKLDEKENHDDVYSIKSSSIRKYSSASTHDDSEQFLSELNSKISSRLYQKESEDKMLDDDYHPRTSRFLNKQSNSRDERDFSSSFLKKNQQEDDYLSSSSNRRQIKRLNSKEETSSIISGKSTSRFLSKFSSRDIDEIDDDFNTNKYTVITRKEYNSKFSSKEDLNKDDEYSSLSRFKKYSRDETSGSVMSTLNEKSNDKIEYNSMSSFSFKSNRMFKESLDEPTNNSLPVKESFSEKELQSKSYLDNNSTLDAKESAYYVIIDYNPPKSSPDEVPLLEGQRVTVLSKDKPNKWRIQTHNYKEAVGTIGFAPSCYLEPVEDALPGTSGNSSSKDSLGKSASVQQAEKKRKTIIKELFETEEDFNRDMQFISNTYLKHMESSLMPKELRENRYEVFNTFRQIANFHNDVLSKAIQYYYQEEPKRIENAFLRMEREFDLHVAYCRDLPQVQEMLKEGPFKEYFDNYSSKIKDDKRLIDHLKLPVQRINDYQLLFKELIKYTARTNEPTRNLEKTLEMIQGIPQRAADLKLIFSIQGYRKNLHDTGRLLKQDWFKVIGPDNKSQERYCLLFRQKILITDQQNGSLPGEKIYFIKNIFKLNDINIVQGDDKVSLVINQKGDELNRNLPITLKAETEEQKSNWLNEIYNCRQLTREELADEKEPEFIIEEPETESRHLSKNNSLETNDKDNSFDLNNRKLSLNNNQITIEKVNQSSLEKPISISEDLNETNLKQNLYSSFADESRQNLIDSIKLEDLSDFKNESIKRKSSRDLPEGLPKPIKQATIDLAKPSASLSKQTTQSDLSRKPSVTSIGEKTPELTLSRRSSTTETKSNRSSLKLNSTDKPEPLSRRNSSKSDKSDEHKAETDKKLDEKKIDDNKIEEKKSSSRQSSKKSTSSKLSESKTFDNFDMYEEKTIIPMTGEVTSQHKLEKQETGEKLSFKKELQNVIAESNKTILLECELDSCKEDVIIEWLRDNKVLNIAGRYKTNRIDNVFTLQINNAITRDNGLYSFTATNSTNQIITKAQVTIKPFQRQDSRPSTPGGTFLPHPPVFKIKLKDTDVLEGSTIHFELLIHGMPIPKLTFYKNEKILNENDHLKIEYQSKEAFEIVIENVKLSDSGHYRVVAQNTEGTDSTACNLTVSSEKELFKGLENELGDANILSPRSETPVSEKLPSTFSRMSSNAGSRPRTPAFKWFKDGSEFDASERFLCQFNEDEDTIGLVFQHVTPEDAGLYTCVASTTGGKISCSAELTVQGEVNRLLRDPEPPKFLDVLNDCIVSEGSTATIEVKVTGYPKPIVTWLHNDKELNIPSDKHKLLYEDDDTMTLIIKNAKEEDAGKYQVIAKNELGEVQDECNVIIKSPPKFVEKLKDGDVLKNQSLELCVKVEASPKPNVEWFKDGKLLSEHDKSKFKFDCVQDGNLYVFTAKCDEIDLTDAGNYSVTVSNECAQQSCACTVNVKAPPEISGMNDLGGKLGDTVHFRIKVLGSPKPEVTFLKDNKPIDLNNDNLKLEEEEGGYYRLTISKLNNDHCGKYTVVAKNELGEIKCDARLDIKCKPEFAKKLNDLESKEGENASLKIKLDGFPKPELIFKFNDKPIDLTNKDKFKLESDSDGNVTLKIKDVNLDDAGKYSVVAKNSEGESECSCSLKINIPPKFTCPLKNIVINEHDKLDLVCKYTGLPKPEITWYKNNKKITIDDKKYLFVETKLDNDETECKLIISGSVQTDTSKYKCKAKNISGETSTEADVLVSSMPIFLEGLSNVDAKDKDKDIEFKVKIKPQPNEPAVKWYIGDQPIEEDNPNFMFIKPIKDNTKSFEVTEDGDEYKLIIKEASPSLSGLIKCEARNNSGVSECYANFTVKKAPHFIEKFNENNYFEQNAKAFLKVKVAGNPKPNLKWKRNGEELSTSATIVIKEDVKNENGEYEVTSLLEIQKLTIDLTGDFECIATNELGEVVAKGKVYIGEKPKILGKLQDLICNEGDYLEYEVKISGNPEPEITWFKDGKEIGTNDDINLEKLGNDTFKLKVKSCILDHKGEYQVLAKNPLGETNDKGKIQVGSKPKIIDQLTDSIVQEGDSVVFRTKIIGFPDPEFTWFKDGKKLENNKDFEIQKLDDGTVELKIKSCNSDHKGEYYIVAKNNLGEVSSNKAQLKVKPVESGQESRNRLKKRFSSEDQTDKDKNNQKNSLLNEKADNEDGKNKKKNLLNKTFDSFDRDSKLPKISGITDVCANLGDSVTLTAIVTGTPNPEVTWFKQGISLGSTDNIIISIGDEAFKNANRESQNYLESNLGNGTLHSLTIKNIISDNLGDYTIKANNKYGDAEKTINLNLKPNTPMFLQELPDRVKVKEGTQLKLEVKIDGDPMPCVKWFKNGREIVTNDLNDQLNRLTDPQSSSSNDQLNQGQNDYNKNEGLNSKKNSIKKDSRTSSKDGLGSKKNSITSNEDGTDKRSLVNKKKSFDAGQNLSNEKHLKTLNDNLSQNESNFFSNQKSVGIANYLPNYCNLTNDIFINDKIKIQNFANGVCILTIDKAKEEDEGIYSVMAVNKNDSLTSNCRVNVVSKYYREYSPPASVKHKMQTDPNYKPPIEWGLKNRKPNEHFDFKSETHYTIGPDTYVLQYRDTDFPLRIREYLRVGSSRSASLANNLKESHWGYAHPDTGYYPTVSVRERRKFVDVMDEEINDEKKGETLRKKPMRLIREIPTSGRGYGQVVTLRSEVARANSKEEDEEINNLQTNSSKANLTEESNQNEDKNQIKNKIKKKKLLKSEIPFFREKIKDTTSAEEETVVFQCFAVGDPEPNYTWFKNDFLLMSDTKLSIRTNEEGRAELEIKDVNEYDYSRYKCLARNDCGAVVCTAFLKAPGTINSIPNEDTQLDLLDYSVECEKSKTHNEIKQEDLYNFHHIYSKGRYCLVLKATEKASSKQVACKVVSDKDLIESGFIEELDVLSTLCHERIVRFESACKFNGLNVIAMEPLSGIDVLTYLSLQSTFTEALVSKIISQVTDAIEYLHFRGIALLELQPDNVVMKNAAQPFIKLVDFANARYLSAKNQFDLELKGNDAYLAPEILLKEKITFAADIWCIGVLTYILISGHNPFAGENEKDTRDNVCFVRFSFDRLFKQASSEAIRFLVFIFKKDAEKRPKIEEVQNNKWLFPDEQLARKRESVQFLGAWLNAFSIEFHNEKERNSQDELAKLCGV